MVCLHSNRTRTKTVLNAEVVQQQLVAKTFGCYCSGRLSEDQQPPRVAGCREDAVGAVLHSRAQQLGLLLCPWASQWRKFRSHAGRRERIENGQEGTVLECCVTQAEAGGSYHAECPPGSKAPESPGFWRPAEGECLQGTVTSQGIYTRQKGQVA